MKLRILTHCKRGSRQSAFSLVEMMVATAIFGATAVALYTGIAQGFSVVQLARENLRATQILCEKAETLRLYTWDQITAPGFVPPEFTSQFYPTKSGEESGFIYSGRVTIRPLDLPTTTYSDDLREVRIDLNWTSGQVERRRTMTTWVSRYGLYRYVY